MTILFWLISLLIFYCYFGYPLLLVILAKIKTRPVKKAAILPSVSILIAVCDEEDVIEQKIKNLLNLDYPADQLEILIGSDGSVDRTVEIIKKFEHARIKLFQSPMRRGKMATLNQLYVHAEGKIFVLTDARQTFERNAIRELTANFADPHVGCVSGELVFYNKEGITAEGVGLYWNYEKFLRKKESQIHSMLGATGAIYAVRRELYCASPNNVILDDMYTPLQIILKGYRAVFDPHAKAYDEVARIPQEEHRRKARTLYGNYQIFFLLPQVFNPRCSPIALQMLSHKFLRLLIPFLLLAVFILNLFLLDQPLYQIVFFLQIVFYGLAVVGALAEKKKYGIFKGLSKASYIPYVFCLLNFSALIGFIRFIQAKQEITWEKARTKHGC